MGIYEKIMTTVEKVIDAGVPRGTAYYSNYEGFKIALLDYDILAELEDEPLTKFGFSKKCHVTVTQEEKQALIDETGRTSFIIKGYEVSVNAKGE